MRMLRHLAGLGLVLLLTARCSGGGDGGTIPLDLDASFTPSGTPATPDGVRLIAGPAVDDHIEIAVVLGGPTESSDIYSFVFDLVLGDASVAEYVAGSAELGDALVLEGGQGALVQASQNGDRVVVGVSKSGGGAGNGVGPAEPAVVRLTFRVLQAGVASITLAGSPANPQDPSDDPVAFDSGGAVIPSIAFDTAPAQLAGM